MDFLLFMKNNKLVILIVSILLNILLLISTSILLFQNTSEECNMDTDITLSKKEETEEKEDEVTIKKDYYVEIKGAVTSPGVYFVNDQNIINDVIKMAGGFTEDAYTNNINLARHLEEELVIYVYTKNEYKNKDNQNSECSSSTYDITNCKDSLKSIISSNKNSSSKDTNTTSSTNTTNDSNSTNNTNNDNNANKASGKVNINTASISELMTLSGIGEAKAKDIINYRNTNGLFKSIEDIKKVSGIKDATFNKIKDNITV